MPYTKLICTPWADLTDLPEQRPPGLTDNEWESLLWQSSELLYGLSGRQFAGECESAVTLRENLYGVCGWSYWGRPGDDWVWSPPSGFRGGSGKRVVALPDPPVTAITSVQIDGTDVDPDTYTVTLPAGLLERANAWPTNGTLEIIYRHGILPPIGGTNSAVLLAVELAKAYMGDATCKLPQRLTTVTREGVTAAFRDNFESLKDLRTGLYPVDLWLTSVNPKGLTRRARVWTPRMARPQRTTT